MIPLYRKWQYLHFMRNTQSKEFFFVSGIALKKTPQDTGKAVDRGSTTTITTTTTNEA